MDNEYFINMPEEIPERIEIPQFIHKLTLWEAMKSFFNSHFNENVRRSELIKFLKENFYNNRNRWGEYRTSFTTMDTYRNYLYKAGYLTKIITGVYRLTREIPYGLTLKQIVYEAYHHRKEEKYNIYGELVRTSETITRLYRKHPTLKKKEEFLSKEEMEL